MAAPLKPVTGGINQEREGGRDGGREEGRDGKTPTLQTHPIDPSHLSVKLGELHPLRSAGGMHGRRFLLGAGVGWGSAGRKGEDVCAADDER